MLKNLIIEGCDCSGKSTLIKEITNKYKKYKIIKCNNPVSKESALNEYLDIILRLKREQNLICDRFMLSEVVYSPIYRSYYPEYIRRLERHICGNSILILVDCSLLELRKRFDSVFIRKDDIERIKYNFIKQFCISNYKYKIILDSTKKLPIELLKELETRIKWIN